MPDLDIKRVNSAADPRFDALYAIYRESIAVAEQKSKAELSVMVSRPKYGFFVAQEGERVAGFTITYLIMAEALCLLEYLAVDRIFRRRGLGSELFRRTANIVRARAGPIPILLEVDSEREPSLDQDIRRRREDFYRRLGCRRIADCTYILPLAGASPVPKIDLFVQVLDPAAAIPRPKLKRWLQMIYRDVYNCSVNDPRIDIMMEALPDPIQLA